VLALPNVSLLLVMACFWLVYLVVSTQLVGPLGRVLSERARRIREARETHESSRAALDDAVARCERELAGAAAESQKARAALRAAGEASRRARLEQARTQMQERLTRLDAELDEAARAARADLRGRASVLARELASRLVGRGVA
jgi:F0F1-type ATP synthase membrane subunit b/b'